MARTPPSRLLDIELYLKAAEAHADGTGEWEHWIGDLQDYLRHIWLKVLTRRQRITFARSRFVKERLLTALCVDQDSDEDNDEFDYRAELKKLR